MNEAEFTQRLKIKFEQGEMDTPVEASLLIPKQRDQFCCTQTFHMARSEQPDFYNTTWMAIGDIADWVGFMDDYGTFWALDWC